MKIDRLVSILIYLLQRERTTAPELAERFQVSRRTIQRDIDDLCLAGIPVITKQGGNGGVYLWEGYRMDKSFLTKDELQDIIYGLKGLSSVSKSSNLEGIIDKLAPKGDGIVSTRDSIFIDLASHYKDSIAPKIELIKDCIKDQQLISFDYYSSRGCHRRVVEPIYIVFKWEAWYIFAYCRDREDFRLFKLNRMIDVRPEEEGFTQRNVEWDKSELDSYHNDNNYITIVFDRSVEHRVLDSYGPKSYRVIDDRHIELRVGYTNRDFIIGWVLAFGDKARVIEPIDIADEIKKIASCMIKNYEQDI